ncbi:UVI-1 [Astrocystis sublimbata]|nr:UVI-1 [Astrocystis sublimbata]
MPVTASQIVDHIGTLTTKSHDLQSVAQSISMVNAPLIVIGQGPYPQIIQGLADIVSTATNFSSTLPPTTDEADATKILDAYRNFVKVHQELLNILIAKGGMVSSIPPVNQPMSAILRTEESALDSFAFSLIDSVQPKSEDLQKEANSLSATLEQATQAYTQ